MNNSDESSASKPNLQQQYALPNLEIEEAAAAVDADEIELVSLPNVQPKIEADAGLLQDIHSIPDKMAFKIGEAADMVGVKQYVLRYWETEFEVLRPKKSKNNQRVYSRRDVETAMMIKKLLYQDRFSIEGARTAIRQLRANVKEEKGVKALALSQETAVAKIQGLVEDIQRLQRMF